MGVVFITPTLAQLNISPNPLLSVCPSVEKVYSVTGFNVTCPSSSYDYDWSVSGGVINGDKLLPTVKVSWYNDIFLKVLSVKLKSNNVNCQDVELESNVFTKNLEGKSTDIIKPAFQYYIANFAQTILFETEEVDYNNPGPIDPNDQIEVDFYEWTKPSGWTVTSVPNTEFQQIDLNIPATEIPIANICVKGKGHCTSMESMQDCFELYPYVPSPCETSEIQGNSEVQCNIINPLIYSCAKVDGATQYEWTIPSGWSAPSLITTTNSIVVTPNGLNGGTITVKAKAITLFSETCSKNIEIKVVVNSQSVGIQGPNPDPVCTAGVLTLTNYPLNSPISWNIISSFCQPSSGTGASASFNITQPNLNGDPPITFTIDPPMGCLAEPFKITRNFHFGAPTMTKPRLDGVDVQPWQSLSVCPGSHYVQVTPTGFGAQIPNISWAVSPSVPSYPGVNNTFDFYLSPSGPNAFTITATSTNVCGSSTYNFFISKRIYGCGYGYGILVYPNPAIDQITVELQALADYSENDVSEAETIKQIRIYDKFGNLHYEQDVFGDVVNIPLGGWPKGEYMVQAVLNQSTLQRWMLITE